MHDLHVSFAVRPSCRNISKHYSFSDVSVMRLGNYLLAASLEAASSHEPSDLGGLI